MRNLEGIIKKIDDHINEKDKVREKALRSSRDIIIHCRKAIQLLHTSHVKEADQLIQQASTKLISLNNDTESFPDIFHAGYVENAAQEFVEARCFYNIMTNQELPDPDELQTTYSAYLLGLCDVVGELRRGALDFILEGDTDKAYEYLGYMDMLYDAIMQFDYPSSLIPVKKKQDVARSLIEKTRGELAVASCERRIDDRTNEFRGLLDRVNHQSSSKKQGKTGKIDDLDVDKVW